MENLDGLKVLVTGANGFLGTRLLTQLAGGKADLHAVSRSVPSEDSRVRWWQGSAANLNWIRELIVHLKPDVIYQLASASMGGQDAKYVAAAFESDLQTTVNVLVAAQESGVKRVIITRSLDEPSPGEMKAPRSPYAASKAAGGLYGRMFYELYGLPVVMLRPFMTYGPGQKAHKVIPYTILAMLRGESPTLSSATRAVDWVYVDDVISAFATAAVRPEAVGKEIDLGSGKLVPISRMVEEIRRLIPSSPAPIFAQKSDRVNEQVRVADVEAAKATLGWRASTPLRDGLLQTIEWYRDRQNLSASLAPRPRLGITLRN